MLKVYFYHRSIKIPLNQKIDDEICWYSFFYNLLLVIRILTSFKRKYAEIYFSTISRFYRVKFAYYIVFRYYIIYFKNNI